MVLLDLTSQNGTDGYCLDSGCDFTNLSSSPPTTVGYINTTPSGNWTITISPTSGAFSVGVSDFNAAGAPQDQSPVPGSRHAPPDRRGTHLHALDETVAQALLHDSADCVGYLRRFTEAA